MLKHIRVIPLAAESLGVRSMCSYVETDDVRILLDAGVSLCPNRYGLPPHPLEFKAISKCRKMIASFAKKTDVVTLSHYHFDHHTPSFEDWLCNWTEANETARQIYENKIVLIKNPKESINYSQRRRGWMFQKTTGKYAASLGIADGESFNFGETVMRFSEPVYHGSEESGLGWVLMSIIECRDEKLMFAPDIQGPVSPHSLELIINERPQMLIIGGPPSYLEGFKVEKNQIQAGLENLQRIVRIVSMTILEHHLLRDECWKERAKGVFTNASEAGCSVVTAAEFLGENSQFLEAKRRKLFAESIQSKEFQKWMRLGDESKKHVKPPV